MMQGFSLCLGYVSTDMYWDLGTFKWVANELSSFLFKFGWNLIELKKNMFKLCLFISQADIKLALIELIMSELEQLNFLTH